MVRVGAVRVRTRVSHFLPQLQILQQAEAPFKRTPSALDKSFMDLFMLVVDALKEACADAIACWPQAASQEPRVPKEPLAITSLAATSPQTFGQELDAESTPSSQSRGPRSTEGDIGTWYATSPDKASGLQAASRAVHGMLELPALRPSCSPTAGHALDVQRSWLSRQLSFSETRPEAETSPCTTRSFSSSFSSSTGLEPEVAAGWRGRADSCPLTSRLREYRPPTANQPYRSPPLKPTANQPYRRSNAMTPEFPQQSSRSQFWLER